MPCLLMDWKILNERIDFHVALALAAPLVVGLIVGIAALCTLEWKLPWRKISSYHWDSVRELPFPNI